MRSLVAFTAGIVALAALAVTLPMLWVSTHVADEDGYVAFSSVLAEDPELQSAFAAFLGDELVNRGVLPSVVRPAATSALAQAARRASNAPGFVSAWEETQRRFHRSTFADPTPPVLTVDVGPLASFVVERVTDRLPVTLTVPDELVVPMASDAKDRRAIERVSDTTGLARVGTVAALLGLVVSLVAARRTSVTLMWLGAGTVAVSGLLWLASGPAAQRVLDHTSAPSDFARTLHKLLVDRAHDSFAAWLLLTAIVGGVAAVAGGVGRAVTRTP